MQEEALEPLWRSVLRLIIWAFILGGAAVLVLPAITIAPIWALWSAPWWVAAIFWANALIAWGLLLGGFTEG